MGWGSKHVLDHAEPLNLCEGIQRVLVTVGSLGGFFNAEGLGSYLYIKLRSHSLSENYGTWNFCFKVQQWLSVFQATHDSNSPLAKSHI